MLYAALFPVHWEFAIKAGELGSWEAGGEVGRLQELGVTPLDPCSYASGRRRGLRV